MVPDQASLRKLVNAILRTDSDLEAFCSDYYPAVADRFTSGMDRVQKVTMLLAHAKPAHLGERLRKVYPERRQEIHAFVPPAIDEACPFPGLAPFDEDRAADFFGREAEVAGALAELAKSRPPLRWLQIDGPSGAGKSSFARAGIVPAVRAGMLAGKAWVTAVLRPGHDPIANLAEALVKHAKPSLALNVLDLHDVKTKLQGSPTALACLLREGRPNGHGVLLLVDQLEEAFTLAHGDETAVKQLDMLLAAALDDWDVPLVLVTTIRSDFVARMGELPKLEDKLAKHQAVRFYLKAMDEAGLRAAIEKPAERVGLSYEAGLVDRIVADAGASHGALPLVAHVLEALYARREGHMLTARAYELVGGVGGALAKSADAIVDDLDGDRRTRARGLLLRLVKIGRDSADTRQTASREAALGAAGGGPEAERLLTRLSGGRDIGWGTSDVAERLVVVSDEAGSERVDLVHEALIQRWATLRTWIKDERKTLELRDDVEAAARAWKASGEDEGGLPKGNALARFRDVERAALQEGARKYLDAAEAAERRAEQERQAQQEEKRKATERRQRRLIARLVALVLLLGILTARTILLARELEASKRAQIMQANINMAAMVAGTVLSQLSALSDAVKRVASDEEVGRAVQNEDWVKLQDLCERTYEFYDDPSHGLKRNGILPFDNWNVLGNDGIIKARFGKSKGSVSLGNEVPWRDYVQGAWKVAGKGLSSPYVSRAFKSEHDDFYKFAISAPIYGNDKRPVGVIVAAVASKANLGSLDLAKTQGIAVLVAPRDRERIDPKPETPFLILRHPAIAYGEGIGMDNEQVRSVSEADLNSEARIVRPLWPPAPNQVTSSDNYEDPVAKTRPGFEGRWLAGFAPVGNTGFVVIVQTRETEATSDMDLVWQLAKWAAIATIPGTLLLVFMAWRGRRRRSAHASSSLSRNLR